MCASGHAQGLAVVKVVALGTCVMRYIQVELYGCVVCMNYVHKVDPLSRILKHRRISVFLQVFLVNSISVTATARCVSPQLIYGIVTVALSE